ATKLRLFLERSDVALRLHGQLGAAFDVFRVHGRVTFDDDGAMAEGAAAGATAAVLDPCAFRLLRYVDGVLRALTDLRDLVGRACHRHARAVLRVLDRRLRAADGARAMGHPHRAGAFSARGLCFLVAFLRLATEPIELELVERSDRDLRAVGDLAGRELRA